MSEYVIMPKADYTAACDAIRAKTGKAELIKSGDMPSEILGIVSGGGSSADVRYVTFMSEDGTVELGKKAVAVGDDCADPIARGVFPTPTKESTAQYNYTFYGWAATPNGAADSNWNKAVTEDKTVYATFASVVRYYTITYYDSDGTTVLKTESLAYGAMPSSSYTPTKDGLMFNGWEPELTGVVGDTSYVAKWAEKLNFADASWADIARVSEAGEAQKHFAIGDAKVITFTAPDGKSYTLPVVIIAFSHDTLASGGTAGITCVLANTCGYAAMNEKDKTYNGSTSAYAGAWGQCDLRAAMTTVFNSFDENLRNAIKLVSKKTYIYGGVQGSSTDRVWLLSNGEIYGKAVSTYGLLVDGTHYAYFDSNSARIHKDTSGTAQAFWLRSGTSKSPMNCGMVNTSGQTMATTALTTNYVVFGFCI